MTAAISFNNVTKRFVKPGLTRRGWAARVNGGIPGASAKSSGSFSESSSHGFMEEKLVIDHVSFQVEEGEIFGVVGPTGAGKSTLLRLIATLIQPDDGDVRIHGFSTKRQPIKVQRLINRVSIEASFFKQMSALENLTQAARMTGHTSGNLVDRAEFLLRELGMDRSEMTIPMEHLSTSLHQLVTFTRALLSRPRLLLLDDPSRGLDVRFRIGMMRLIDEWRAETGGTVLVTGTRLQELSQVCDRIISIFNGTIDELQASPVQGMQLPIGVQVHSKPVAAMEIEPE